MCSIHTNFVIHLRCFSDRKNTKDADTKSERKTAYQDNTDRIEVERKFILSKRKFGLGLLLTKREDTTKASIALSVIAMNIDRLAAMLLRLLKFTLSFFIFDNRKL